MGTNAGGALPSTEPMAATARASSYEAEQNARAEAETAERRFRLLLDGVGDYALYMLDREGRAASASP